MPNGPFVTPSKVLALLYAVAPVPCNASMLVIFVASCVCVQAKSEDPVLRSAATPPKAPKFTLALALVVAPVPPLSIAIIVFCKTYLLSKSLNAPASNKSQVVPLLI